MKNQEQEEQKDQSTPLQDLKAVLNDPQKALRLGLFNAERHTEQDAFLKWEGSELGSTQDIISGYKGMVKSIDQPLSRELINEIRTSMYQEGQKSRYGWVLKSGHSDINRLYRDDISEERFFGLSGITKEKSEEMNDDAALLKSRLLSKISRPGKDMIVEEPEEPYFVFNSERNVHATPKYELAGAMFESQDYMELIIEDYNKNIESSTTKDAKIETISTLVRDLERVHPYVDFNCRTFAVLVLNRELVKNELQPAILEDPNMFDYETIDNLKGLISQGQHNFQNLAKTGLVHEQDPTNQQWLEAIPQDKKGVIAQFHKVTQDSYKDVMRVKEKKEVLQKVIEEAKIIGSNLQGLQVQSRKPSNIIITKKDNRSQSR